ncbi:hypothetical protein, partial [Salmonella enterica]|uniref:hypothetical protein n=1 Tax=Salmonella enterica TaxID=28901 RepID=UPI00195CE45A
YCHSVYPVHYLQVLLNPQNAHHLWSHYPKLYSHHDVDPEILEAGHLLAYYCHSVYPVHYLQVLLNPQNAHHLW